MASLVLEPQSDVFAYLQAEYENPWLPDIFVPPDEFMSMLSNRSLVVYGASGSGKSLLRMALVHYIYQQQSAGKRLIVEWQPTPIVNPSGTSIARACLEQIFYQWVWTLLEEIGKQPEQFHAAASWVKETLRWFVHQYIPDVQTEHDILLSKLAEEATDEGAEAQRTILAQPARSVLRADSPEPRLIAELIGITQKLGINAVWVITDGLEQLTDYDPQQTTLTLKSFLSTLSLFESPALAIKIVAPLELEAIISTTGGVARRRIDQYWLRWSQQHLEQIAARRVAALLGQPAFDLDKLYPQSEISTWLAERGNTPREWLEHLRPLVRTYVRQGASKPLNRSQWMGIAYDVPQVLRIDIATNRVFVGNKEIRDIQPGPYKLLLYLYHHRERICTRSELYYLALLELKSEPRSQGDESYSSPSEYESMLNNTIWRLRQTVEPDPNKPTFIVTVRGRGMKLERAT